MANDATPSPGATPSPAEGVSFPETQWRRHLHAFNEAAADFRRDRDRIAEALADVGCEHGDNPDNRTAWIDYYRRHADALLVGPIAEIATAARAAALREAAEEYDPMFGPGNTATVRKWLRDRAAALGTRETA